MPRRSPNLPEPEPPERYRILWSQAEIEQFNARHDTNYGWSYDFPSLYLNPLRLPETVIGRVPWAEAV